MNNSITITALLAVVLAIFMSSMISNQHIEAIDNYENIGFRLIHNPLICIVDPAPARAFPDLSIQLPQQAENMIKTWKDGLQMGASAKAWNMSSVRIPYNDSTILNSFNCDITINFEPTAYPHAETLQPVGRTTYDFTHHTAKIVIGYLGIITEVHTKLDDARIHIFYWTVPLRYDTDHLADKSVIDGELYTELGHAFGFSGNLTSREPYGVNGFNSPIQSQSSSVSQPIVPSQSSQPKPTILIPAKVKSNANDWSNDNNGNEKFVQVLRWLDFENAIKLQQTSQSSDWQTVIPSWIKKDTKLWINGDMTDKDYFSALQYLIDNKIITLNPYD